MNFRIALIILAVLAFVTFLFSLKVLQPNERMVVLKSGGHIVVLGPGLYFIIPFINRIARVDLHRRFADWQSMTEDQIATELKAAVRAENDENGKSSR